VSIRIKCVYLHISYLRTNSQSSIRWQCPGCGGPCQEKDIAMSFFKQELRFFISDYPELGSNRIILNILVCSGLVELMVAYTCTCSRRIGLDGIPFIQHPLFMEFRKKMPYRFNIFIFKCDIRIIEIDPVTDLFSDIIPEVFEFHNLGTTGLVVILNRYLFPDILFGDAKGFFNSNFNRKAMCVPSGFTLDIKSFHCFITAENIFYSSCHHMMNPWYAIGRWWAFIENIRCMILTDFQAFLKDIILFPVLPDLITSISKI